MSLSRRLGWVAAGVGAIVAAPVVATVAVSGAITAGAVAATVGLVTEAAAAGAAVTVGTAVEEAVVTIGTGLIAKGVSKSIE